MVSAGPLALPGDDEIVSSKELNLVRFIIQPSILRSSLSSVTFCQETFRVVDETASTMTSSGWPGNVLIPSATPVCVCVFSSYMLFVCPPVMIW